MLNKTIVYICIFLSFSILCLNYEKADARIGGGRSFGGKPFMSRPYTRPIPSSPTMSQQPNVSQPPQTGTMTGSSQRFGGMGGILGGLLAGSLIGSLLFGGGFSGGGLLDILLIVGLVYLAFKLFSRKRMSPQEVHTGTSMYNTQQSLSSNNTFNNTLERSSPTLSHGTGWEALQTKNPNSKSNDQSISTPTWFDEEEFLTGAKATYTRLNEAWDNRDMQDIAQFTTPTFMKELKKQLDKEPDPEKTEIILVNASVIEIKTLEDEECVSVYFNVLLREAHHTESPIDIREIWHFVRPITGESSWKVDGIQQVETN